MSAWRTTAYRAVRPVLFAADPESIHHLTLSALSLAGRSAVGRRLCAFASGVSEADAASRPFGTMGLSFRNRIGLGAGFDKDGVAIRGWAALGLGFIELGTVTPRPQPGNQKPRLFRLVADEALVNRMGFNNLGADALAARIRAARPHLPDGFVIGVNIGCNRETPDDHTVDDYVSAARSVADVADYIAVNVSSPNTPGLRDLQDPARLTELLAAVATVASDRPIVVKLSPDLADEDRDVLMRTLVDSPASGVILSNTTTDRASIGSANQPGGLSGAPLSERTSRTVQRATSSLLAVVASGGIGSGQDASSLLRGGADLVQLWTGMIYAGPGLIGEAQRAQPAVSREMTPATERRR